jgi:hypothetical protein
MGDLVQAPADEYFAHGMPEQCQKCERPRRVSKDGTNQRCPFYLVSANCCPFRYNACAVYVSDRSLYGCAQAERLDLTSRVV